MKKLLMAVAVVSALSLGAMAHEMGEMGKGEAGKDVSLTGEVLDLACYVGHGAMGPKHAECAKACAKGGAPMGLLVGSKVYVLVNDHNHQEPYDQLKGYAGETVKVTGDLSTKNGLPALVAEKVEKS